MSIEMGCDQSRKEHFCQEIRDGHVLKEVQEVNMKVNHSSSLFLTHKSLSHQRVTVF